MQTHTIELTDREQEIIRLALIYRREQLLHDDTDDTGDNIERIRNLLERFYAL